MESNLTSRRERRRYKRLAPAEEAALCAAWEGGALTLDDLAVRFSMSKRGVQQALRRLGASKGAIVTSTIITTNASALAEMPPLPEEHTERVKAARDAAYRDACQLQHLAMAMAKESAQIGGAAGVRLLSKLADTLVKTRSVVWASLGIDRMPPVDGELPELPIRDLSEAEVAAIRHQQAVEDAELGLCLEPAPPQPVWDIEIVEEGELGTTDAQPHVDRVGGDDGPL